MTEFSPLAFLESLGVPDHLGLSFACARYDPVMASYDGDDDSLTYERSWRHWSHASPSWWADHLAKYGADSETAVRLLGFDRATAKGLPRFKAGELRQALQSYGPCIDVDVAENREEGGGYAPTIADALELITGVLAPTWALDTAGGVPAAFVFDTPLSIEQYGHERLKSLGRRFAKLFENAVTGAGYKFDSPQPFTAAIRLPGATTRYGRRVGVLIADGPRYSIEQLEDLTASIPEYHSARYDGSGFGGGPMTWNGEAIPQPTWREPRQRRPREWTPEESTWNP